MILRTLRDNQSPRYNGLSEPVTIITSVIAIASGLMKIFGGTDPGHYDSTGRFIPGDLNNRLQFLAEWMSRYGLTAYDIDKNLVDSFIYQPSGWQGEVSGYVQRTAEDKKNNPQNYYPNVKRNSAPDTNKNSATLFGNMDITTILLIGAAAYAFMQLAGNKRKGRR